VREVQVGMADAAKVDRDGDVVGPRSASLEDIAIPKAESQCQLEPLA